VVIAKNLSEILQPRFRCKRRGVINVIEINERGFVAHDLLVEDVTFPSAY